MQPAIKTLLEQLCEATVWQNSYAFRPEGSCQAALEHIRMTIQPPENPSDGRRQPAPYQWVIKGCLDHIAPLHQWLMQYIRAPIGDSKGTHLIGHFLKAGLLEEGYRLPTR